MLAKIKEIEGFNEAGAVGPGWRPLPTLRVAALQNASLQ